MLSFEIGALRVEGAVDHPLRAILAIGGPFQIQFEGRAWYAEPDFPILELLRDLLDWASADAPRPPLVYESMESAEPWLVRADPTGDLWRFHSPHERYSGPEATTEDVLEALAELTRVVRDALPERETVLRVLGAAPSNARLVSALS